MMPSGCLPGARVPRGVLPLGRALALLGVVGLTLLSATAQAQVLRFSETRPGGILAVGNAIGLSKQLDANGPGTEDSIGTFISLANTVDSTPANVGNPWPAFTTWDWQANGSTAELPLGTEIEGVLYAELVWGGSSFYGADDVRSSINQAVTLSFGDDSIEVDPDPATALTLETMSNDPVSPFAVNYYVRSGEVTQFVQSHGGGTYSVSAIPATQNELIDELNAGGWTLVVAYREEFQPYRNLSIFVGGGWVDEYAQEDYNVVGFCAPPTGAIEGRVAVSALEGDADRTGDSLAIGETPTDPTFVDLSGPNNPEDNFFCSQVNGPDGLVDTLGSFGDANHNAITGVNVSGSRQGWDVTTVEVSSADGHLSPGQTSAVLRTKTEDDSYVPALVAFEIDVKSPDFNGGGSTTETSTEQVTIGDTFTVTARLENTGEATAANVVLHMDVDAGLDLTSFGIDGSPGDIDGNPVDEATLESGAAVGDVEVGKTLNVVLGFQVVGPPENGSSFPFVPVWEHGFQMCTGGDTISDEYTSERLNVPYWSQGTGGSGGGAAAGGTGGEAASGNTGNVGNSGNSGPAEDPESEGNCGCATPGADAGHLLGGAGLAWVLGLAAVRRRRRS